MPSSALNIRTLTDCIGAEICELDLREPLDGGLIEAMYSAWLDRQVLLFREQSLSQKDMLRVARYFGEPGVSRRPPQEIPSQYVDLDGNAETLPGIMIISNIRKKGRPEA